MGLLGACLVHKTYACGVFPNFYFITSNFAYIGGLVCLDLVIDSDWRLSLWLCATEPGVGAPRCACGGSLRRFKALLVDLVPF